MTRASCWACRGTAPLTDDHGVPYDIVCGTFFVAGLKEDDFASLTEQQIEKYKDKYSHEMILSVPKQPEAHKKPMKKGET